MHRAVMMTALVGFLAAACGEDGGGGGGGGGSGGGGPGRISLGFDPCDDVFTHQELEALVGNPLEPVDKNDFGTHAHCDWTGVEAGVDATLSTAVYARMEASDFERTRGQFDARALNGIGDQAAYGFRDFLGVMQGSIVVRKGNRGMFAILTGWTNTESVSEDILRQVAEGYAEKL